MANTNNAKIEKFVTAAYAFYGKTELTRSELKNLARNKITVVGAIKSFPVENSKPQAFSLVALATNFNLGIDFNAIEVTGAPIVETPVPMNVENVEQKVEISKPIETVVESVVKETFVPDYSLYIPAKDPLFVETNNYKLIKNIIASKKFLPVYIHGISGVGKTTSVEQACAELGRPYFRCQISADTNDDDILGSYKLIDGNTIFQDGPVIAAMKAGAVLLLDEFDTNPNLMILQGVLEGKPFYNKQTGELIHPQPGFNVFAACNSKGQGEEIAYIGTCTMNEAQLDRFAMYIKQEMPSIAIEKKIAKKSMKEWKISIPDAEFDQLFAFIKQTRDAYNATDNSEYISTRRIGMILKTYSIVNDMRTAVEHTMNRFSEETKTAFMLLYDALVSGNEMPIENDDDKSETETSDNDFEF